MSALRLHHGQLSWEGTFLVEIIAMANARMIHRDFFSSADLHDQPYWAEVLFAGMIVFADNSGVIRADPLFLRNTILAPTPHRRCPSVAAMSHVLCTFVARSMLVVCKLENVSCYRVTNFAKFQHLNRREGKRREENTREDVRVRVEIPPIQPAEFREAAERVEGHYGPEAQLIRDTKKLLQCSTETARERVRSFRTPKAETLHAWKALASSTPLVELRSKAASFSHPDEVPATILPARIFLTEQERLKKIFQEGNI